MRDTIFDNLVNNENDFTELLCNMCNMRSFKEFENIFSDFLGIKDKDIIVETQYKTEKNGRPDLVISYDDGIEFIEVKIGDIELTKNQPEGYINELLDKQEKNKKLHFMIPKNYYHIKELKNRIENIKDPKIIEIKYWEDFFEHCKENKIFLKNEIFSEYYNLLKSWFGYETVVFDKGEKSIMKENGKTMSKAGELLDSINAQLKQNRFKPKAIKEFNEIGIAIYDKNKKDVHYGWIGIWFSLWEETGDCFIFTLSNGDKKRFYNNFINKYKCKTYPDGKAIYKYLCFDDDIFNNCNAGDVVIKKLLEIIKNIK